MTNCDDCGVPKDLTHITPAYRRALWVVVLLNLGMGVAEMTGGIISGSQALKADALDFFGDGVITFVGLLAIGWPLIWRSRIALTQGIFLGCLGLSVFVYTIYRLFVLQIPEAETMGTIAIIALIVNILAALVLIPHRHGDSNVRAIWLFSRNDALGNLAVVIAAIFVGWTGTAWPDLIVAFVIAGLFLHSSFEIIKDARHERKRMP